jgi:hypothetical protein
MSMGTGPFNRGGGASGTVDLTGTRGGGGKGQGGGVEYNDDGAVAFGNTDQVGGGGGTPH